MIQDYILNPKNYKINFQLAENYFYEKMYASATTHYFKAADVSERDDLTAHCLYKAAMCFKAVGGRLSTTATLLKRSIALYPLEDAYIELAEIYVNQKNWIDGYTICSIARQKYDTYILMLLQGICAWWIGNLEESRSLITHAWLNNKYMPENYKQLADKNVRVIGHPRWYTGYTKKLLPVLSKKFDGVETIKHNYSQCFQDMFALYVNNGKKSSYLEIGSGDPEKNSNSKLLEEKGWEGVSIEFDFGCVQKFLLDRKNTVVQADATKVNYTDIFAIMADDTIGYLQVDCDPPEVSFDILQKVLAHNVIFNAITFEHDYYYNTAIRDKSREFLRSKGYKLVFPDVQFTQGLSFEDWWVHKSVSLPKEAYLSQGNITARSYMLDLPEKILLT